MEAQLKMHERELNEFKSGQNVQQVSLYLFILYYT